MCYEPTHIFLRFFSHAHLCVRTAHRILRSSWIQAFNDEFTIRVRHYSMIISVVDFFFPVKLPLFSGTVIGQNDCQWWPPKNSSATPPSFVVILAEWNMKCWWCDPLQNWMFILAIVQSLNEEGNKNVQKERKKNTFAFNSTFFSDFMQFRS